MANYAIMRIEKRKLGSVGRIGNHHERLKAEYKSNPDIDPSRTHQNYHIIEPPSKYRKAVLDRIESVGAKRRKDSVVMQDCFVGGTPDWLKGKTVEEQREYFDYAYRFFEASEKRISFRLWCIWMRQLPICTFALSPSRKKADCPPRRSLAGRRDW